MQLYLLSRSIALKINCSQDFLHTWIQNEKPFHALWVLTIVKAHIKNREQTHTKKNGKISGVCALYIWQIKEWYRAIFYFCNGLLRKDNLKLRKQ